MVRLLNRRNFLVKSGILALGSILISKLGMSKKLFAMDNSPILRKGPLNLPWKTQDPFIFCSYHYDEFPGGNSDLGPNVSLQGRNIGQDFSGKDGWSMYHGQKVPGFPAHPHSGFETVTIVTKGMVDHSDSLGASGRFGQGDVQWLTSGKGVQHAEMFPLLKEDVNPFEIFQLWLNLPRKSKKVDPYYKMLWNEDIPILNLKDNKGKTTQLKIVAGSYNNKKALEPTPDSWAHDENNNVQVWLIEMDPQATFNVPKTEGKLTRSLYFYEGNSFMLGKESISEKCFLDVDSEQELHLHNGDHKAYFLLLQGKPINEPVIQYGPFVANSKKELQETMQLYRATEFGGWPYETSAPVHEKNAGRFSKMPNGEIVTK